MGRPGEGWRRAARRCCHVGAVPAVLLPQPSPPLSYPSSFPPLSSSSSCSRSEAGRGAERCGGAGREWGSVGIRGWVQPIRSSEREGRALLSFLFQPRLVLWLWAVAAGELCLKGNSASKISTVTLRGRGEAGRKPCFPNGWRGNLVY